MHIRLMHAQNILQYRSHIRAQKRLNKFKIEIISSIFSDHNTMKVDIKYKGKNCFKTQTHGYETMHF